MKAIQRIKKMVALGMGLTMVGATIMGASAVKLSDYPGPFVVDGTPHIDGVVIGDKAAAEDVIGAIDISTALQASAVKSVPTPGAVGRVTVQGEVAEVGTPTAAMSIRQPFGHVSNSVLSAADLPNLLSGSSLTGKFTTAYQQYLKAFNTSENSGILRYDYLKDENDVLAGYVTSPREDILFEWQLIFEEGIELDLTAPATGNDWSSTTFDNEMIKLLGETYTVPKKTTKYNNQTQKLSMKFVGGPDDLKGMLRPGEEKSLSYDGKEYKVRLVHASETEEKALFDVNGASLLLASGDVKPTLDGIKLAVTSGHFTGTNTQDQLIEFQLAAKEIALTFNESFVTGGVTVDRESIEAGQVATTTLSAINGGTRGNPFGGLRISDIRYRLKGQPALGGKVFIPENGGLRDQLLEPEGMLSNWDIENKGLTKPGETTLALRSVGDDQYRLQFVNQEGIQYDVPLLSNTNNVFKYGDDSKSLWWMEGGNYDSGGGSQQDLYVLARTSIVWLNNHSPTETIAANQTSNSINTRVLRWDSIDTGRNQAVFTDVGVGAQITSTYAAGGNGTLSVGGNEFRYVINLTTAGAETIVFDLNGDGAVSMNGSSVIAIKGGGIFVPGDFGTFTNPTYSTNITNNGSRYSNAVGSTGVVDMFLVTLPKQFDNNALLGIEGGEFIKISVQNRSGNKLGLNGTVAQAIQGFNKTINSTNSVNMTQDARESTEYRALSTYGVMITAHDETGTTDAEDVLISYPLSQRLVQLYFTGGPTTTTEVQGSTSDQVQPIQVGTAKLASEISDHTASNLIVVGGPCANTVAAKLMGDPSNCTEGFEPGKAIVKLYDHGNGKVALLVAGFNKEDTRRASRAVATDQLKKASGNEAVVKGTSLLDIQVVSV